MYITIMSKNILQNVQEDTQFHPILPFKKHKPLLQSLSVLPRGLLRRSCLQQQLLTWPRGRIQVLHLGTWTHPGSIRLDKRVGLVGMRGPCSDKQENTEVVEISWAG